MLSESRVFERLEKVATFIAGHPGYPGKPEVVAECLGEIDERWQRGELALEQRFQLVSIFVRAATPRLLPAPAV